MKRIILMVVTNLFFVIVCWPKLCRMAAHPERYTKEERWKHLQLSLIHILNRQNGRGAAQSAGADSCLVQLLQNLFFQVAHPFNF